MSTPSQNWFTQNAPKPQGDWFAHNAPKGPATIDLSKSPDYESEVGRSAPKQPPKSLFPNPHKEGEYTLTNGSETVSVPYSRMADALKHGYTFTGPEEQSRFEKDYDFGGKYRVVPQSSYENHEIISRALGKEPESKLAYYSNAIANFVSPQTEGVEKSSRKGIGGVLDIASRWMRSETSPEAIGKYLKDHPGATEEEARDALSPHAHEVQKIADSLRSGTEEHGVVQQAGGFAEQAAELMAPETLAGDLPAAAEAGRVLDFLGGSDIANPLARTAVQTLAEGGKAAVEQGAQQYVRSGGSGKEAESAALFGGILGGAVPVTRELGNFSGEVGRHFLGVSDIHTGKVVRETLAENRKIDQSAAKIIEENNQRIDQYNKDVDAAKEKAAGRTASDTEKADAKRRAHESKVEAARLAHENEVVQQQANAAKKQIANRSRLELRQRVARHVQAIQDAAKSYFNKQYGEIEEAVDGPKDNPKDNRVPWADLSAVVDDALPEIEGSRENVKPLKDIIEKSTKYGADEDEPPPRLEGDKRRISAQMWATMEPDERREAWDAVREEWGPEADGVSFKDLRGYYSEAGRLLASDSTPPDVKQALVKFRDGIDGLEHRMADEAGVGQRYKLLRNQYRNYAEGFLDYQGPNKSGSPVALGLKGRDAYNATRHYIGLEPEELSRVKQILAGSPMDASTKFTDEYIETPGGRRVPASRFRRDSGALIDRLNEAESKLKNISEPKPVGPFVAPEYEEKEVVPTEPKDVRPPDLKEVPEHRRLTPEEVRMEKEERLLRRADFIGHWGSYMAVAGLVGTVTAFLLPHRDTAEAIEHAGEGLLAGAAAPYLLARIIEKPGVIESLSKVRRGDLLRLMKLPPEDRPGVEEMIRSMAEQAEKEGKLKRPSPWLRILGGEIGRQQFAAPASSGTSPQATDQQLDQLDKQLGVSQ